MEAGALAFICHRALSCRPAPLQKTGPVQIFRNLFCCCAEAVRGFSEDEDGSCT